MTGLAIALAGSAPLLSVLFGVRGNDVRSYATVVAITAAVALVASLAPAMRVALLDPMAPLKFE